MRKLTLLGHTLLATILIGLCTPVCAERWFDVEVLIFKRNYDGVDDEIWDPTLQGLDIETKAPLLGPLLNCSDDSCSDAIAVGTLPVVIDGRGWPVSGPTKRQMLPASELQLLDQRRTLDNHAAFTPMLHLAWREVVATRSQAKYYGVMAGDRLPEAILEFGEQPVSHWEIEGGIKVYLQHYLYIESQLVLNELSEEQLPINPPPIEDEQTITLGSAPEPMLDHEDGVLEEEWDESWEEAPGIRVVDENGFEIADDGPPMTPYMSLEPEPKYPLLKPYKFDQKRRVRSGEIHYLDHPKMGILIQIRKSPELDAQAAAQQPVGGHDYLIQTQPTAAGEPSLVQEVARPIEVIQITPNSNSTNL